MCSTKQLTDFLIKQNDGKCLVNKADIVRLTGMGRTWVSELTKDLPHVGGNRMYFIGDVAEELKKRGY